MILMSFGIFSGCADTQPSEAALCVGTDALRTNHAAAVAVGASDAAVVTGAKLIAAIDAACKP